MLLLQSGDPACDSYINLGSHSARSCLTAHQFIEQARSRCSGRSSARIQHHGVHIIDIANDISVLLNIVRRRVISYIVHALSLAAAPVRCPGTRFLYKFRIAKYTIVPDSPPVYRAGTQQVQRQEQRAHTAHVYHNVIVVVLSSIIII